MRDTQKLGSAFVFLSDADGKLAALYAGRETGSTVLKASTFVIGKNKKISFAYVTHGGEASPPVKDLLKAVQDVAGKH
jgi:peroxiredoxin